MKKGAWCVRAVISLCNKRFVVWIRHGQFDTVWAVNGVFVMNKMIDMLDEKLVCSHTMHAARKETIYHENDLKFSHTTWRSMYFWSALCSIEFGFSTQTCLSINQCQLTRKRRLNKVVNFASPGKLRRKNETTSISFFLWKLAKAINKNKSQNSFLKRIWWANAPRAMNGLADH